jgi:hypothetical protein
MRPLRLLAAFTTVLATRAAGQSVAVPDFAPDSAGWITPIAGDFMPVRGSPSPMRSDPGHPFLNNVVALARGVTPTYRIADLSNLNLRPGVKNAMKKDMDEVLAGKIAYSPSTSCEPAGVPAYLLQPSVLYFAQTAKEVVMIQSYNSEVRHVLLDVSHSPNIKRVDIDAGKACR